MTRLRLICYCRKFFYYIIFIATIYIGDDFFISTIVFWIYFYAPI